MSKILGTLTALVLAFAGMFVAAPTHASEHPTPVTFTKVHNLPQTKMLRLVMPDGERVRQRLGTTIDHPARVCPPTKQTRLTWSYKAAGPREVYRLKPGECTKPGPGPVYVELWKVK